MKGPGALSERALVLAPSGRDSAIASAMLEEAGVEPIVCADVQELCRGLNDGAGLAVAVEEALHNADLSALSRWIEDQPAWSDFPFLLLTQRGGGVERNPAARRLSKMLGNVTFVERPFHPTTLLSAVQTALRGRNRQYEARERMEEIQRAEALLERRVAERTHELESANRQLATQIGERERAEDALRQAQRLEAVGQLTSGVAHDFNNLLTVILGNLDFIRRSTDDPSLHRRVEMMSEASRRGARLTAQMLAFSRRQKLEPRAVDLNDTVLGMRDLLHSTIGGSYSIEMELADDLWPAMIDATQIELVILNLVINARDAMSVGGALTIRTDNVVTGEPRRPEEPPPGEFVMISVGDNGSGMTVDVLARVFEPFFTTKEVGKGSGLGLSQVFGLAKQSGGGVRIDTRVGEGSTIAVFLPRASSGVSRQAPPSADARHDGAGRVVLVVDDDDAVREVTAGILQDLGYRVVEAGSGGAALEVLDAEDAIDAVVLDFAMPGMNGAELAREIRARRGATPILFATGYVDSEALEVVDENHIVTKPFIGTDLADKLARSMSATNS